MFINGDGTETSKKLSAEKFIQASKLTMKDLKVTAIVKDCMYYKFITKKGSGWIETLDSNVKLGKIPEEVSAFLKNPDNEEVLNNLQAKLEPYWNS